MWGCTEKQAPSKSAMATNMPAELQGSSVAVGWCEVGCWGPLALRAQAHVVKLGLAEDCTDTLGIITVADAPYFADGILWYRCQLRGVVSANVVAWRGAGVGRTASKFTTSRSAGIKFMQRDRRRGSRAVAAERVGGGRQQCARRHASSIATTVAKMRR